MSEKSSTFAARNNKHDMMTKRNHISLIIVLLCAMEQGVWAEGTPVMRFVPVAGTETEVPLNVITLNELYGIGLPFGNSRELYRFFENQGCNNVAIDSVSLNMGHLNSGMMFIIALMTEFSTL